MSYGANGINVAVEVSEVKPIEITIADQLSDPDALTNLFVRNLNADYISHSELQSYRAIKPAQWAPNIGTVLRREIIERLKEPLDCFPSGEDWKGIIEAKSGSSLIGLALVALTQEAAVPFGTIEDIVIDRQHRGEGYGKAMMQWILKQISNAGIRRAFLESGQENLSAHHLFQQLGFEKTSFVMMRDL